MSFIFSAGLSEIMIGWISIVSLAAFIAMGVDKASAKTRRGRVHERSLWALSLIGGFLGVILGGIVFRHKVGKRSFWPPVIAAFVLWGIVSYVVLFAL